MAPFPWRVHNFFHFASSTIDRSSIFVSGNFSVRPLTARTATWRSFLCLQTVCDAVVPGVVGTLCSSLTPLLALNVVGDCVHSPNYPSDYESNLACDIRFRSDGTLLVDDVATENSLDNFLLDWDTYSESTVP